MENSGKKTLKILDLAGVSSGEGISFLSNADGKALQSREEIF